MALSGWRLRTQYIHLRQCRYHALEAPASLFQVNSGRYEVKGDFAVVLQPGLEGLELPDYNDGVQGSNSISRHFSDVPNTYPNHVWSSETFLYFY